MTLIRIPTLLTSSPYFPVFFWTGGGGVLFGKSHVPKCSYEIISTVTGPKYWHKASSQFGLMAVRADCMLRLSDLHLGFLVRSIYHMGF